MVLFSRNGVKMHCLIIGGNGFIGSHLLDKLLEEKYSIRILDKYAERYRSPIKSVEYVYEDFQNRGVLSEVLKDIDIVFHLVSTTTPKTSNDDPAFDVQSNVLGTLNLLDQCIQNQIKKFIFISSGGTVYGTPELLPITENHTLDPISSYGITKLTIEKYLYLYYQLYGLDYTIIRPSNPYGERQNPESIQGAISVFLGKIIQNKQIEIWGDGSVVRDFIYVKDLVDGIYSAAVNNSPNQIFNMGSGEGHSLNAIIDVLRNVTNRDIKVVYKQGRIFDVPSIYLDITKAKKDLKWIPKTPLEIGIRKTWEYIKSL
jgi:UDP-glucose 4-epimerase